MRSRMARLLPLRRSLSAFFFATPAIASRTCRLCSEASREPEKENEPRAPTMPDKFHPPTGRNHRVQLPALIPSGTDRLEGFRIELMDPDLWRVSFGVAQARHRSDGVPEPPPPSVTERVDGPRNGSRTVEEFPDFDAIDDLRLHKKLFYKLDKSSKEFEECDVNFHRRKSSKKSQEKPMPTNPKRESKKPEKPSPKPSSRGANLVKPKGKAPLQGGEWSRTVGGGMGREAPLVESKKVRAPTFNQLTDPYHLPFCLDIYVSKGSVRACIVHRATSKVVTVAHSISKDMKFDLSSRKDSTACAAVGRVLAQRAIEDDIHNVVYTPRKGDKIEGKLQIVLQSIINHGIDVKVKLKQKNPMKRT